MNGYAYRVTVSGTCTPAVNSNGVATLTVNTAPVITTCQSDITVNVDPSCLSPIINPNIVASGSPAPTISYTYNSNPITFPQQFPPGTYTITAIAGNTCGNSAPCTFNITVSDPITISGQPAAQNVTYGSAATFSTNATSPGSGLSYQWQQNTGSGWNDLFDGGIYSGTTTPTLNLSLPVVAMSGYQYQCVITSGCDGSTVTSNAASLTVAQAPITITADGKTKVYGTADPALTYQVTSGALVGTDAFSGSLTRDAGENAGNYAIKQGTVALSGNYNLTYAGANLVITKATANITVNSYTVNYNGNPHTSTFTAVGVESPTPVDLTSLMDVSATTHTNAGTYNGDAWTFAGNNNYNPANGTVNNSIGKANAVITVNSYTVNYNGNPHTSTFTAVGIESPTPVDLTSLMDVSATTHTNAGTYNNDAWTFAGNNNYNPANGTVNNNIGKANAVITVNSYTVNYNGNPHTSTFTAVGVESPTPVDLTSLMDVSGTTHTNAGTYNGDAWTFAGNNNYNPVNGTVNDAIGTEAITVTADPQTKVYGSPDPALTYNVTTGALAGSDAFTGSLTRNPGESSGTYPITQGTLALSNNYDLSYVGANLTITNIPISASASAGIIECAGGTTTLTVTASGGDGALEYSIDGGTTYQTSNTFTVNTSGNPYTVKVKDADGFTVNTNSVTVTAQPGPTISLSSITGSDAQVLCIGNSIGNITYAIGGNTTGATVTTLPNGLSGSFSAGVFTISGTPAAPGTYPYTVTTTGPCVNVSMSGTITVNDNATISLTSTSADQVVCINTAITNITYSIGGGATNATVSGLPNGVTGSFNSGVFTISGSPTVSGSFNYVVHTDGPCDKPSMGGTITVNGNSSIQLSSSTQSTNQIVCINTPISNIVYAIDDGANNGQVTGLPNGVSGQYNNGTFTISGTPTESGTFHYTVTAKGNCVDASLTGTITINANSTISLSSAAGTNAQIVCINNGISPITYNIGGGGTGASITAGGLPTGVTGSFSGGVFTISGTPTQSGAFNYTITTSGPCVNASANGTITVNANSTISLTSPSGSDAQIVCIHTAINAITYAIGGGGNGASITAGALPNGVAGSYSGGVFTLSGTPTQSGTFNYTVTTGGPCINVSLSGTITVNPDATISLTSGAGSDAQSVCLNNQMNNITYSVAGSGTGATLSGTLPIGVSGSFSGGVFTISGIPTQSGVFNYTVTTTGPCANPVMNGTITVNPLAIVNPVANVTYCNQAAGSGINFTTPTPGTATYAWTSTADIGFGTSGNGNISPFTATNNTNSLITATINVTATVNGCTGAATSFTITVNPSAVVSPVSNLTYCNNDHASAIVFSTPVTGGTETYSWTSSVNIGFGLNGTGNIGAFTAVNTSINPISTTVTVTPSLNGCAGSPITFTLTVNPGANAGTISGSSTICTGSTSQLATNGSLGGTWSSTNTTVATVDATTGVVTGVATGNTTIFYTVSNVCGGSSASFAVAVNPNATAGTINGPAALCVGSSTLLTTNGNSGGTWFSTSPTASISPSGMITGLSAGPATFFYFVTNSCGSSVSAPFTLTINAGSNPGTIIGSSSMCANTANLLLSTGTPGGTWSSSNTSVAIIDGSSGFVLAINAGTTTISYKVASNSCSSGSQTAFFTLTVNPGGNAGVISGTANICAGTSTTLNTTGSSGGTWSSGNSSIATVDANTGMVTGVTQGNVVITYHVSNSCGTGNATFTMFVSPGAVAGTIIGPSAVCVGSPISLSTNGTAGGTWSSSNTSVAIVDSHGQVVGQNAGSAIITYSVSSACATSSTSTNITVNPLPNAGTVSGATTVCAGLSTPFSSTGNTGGVWSSSNMAVATVNASSGIVTGLSAGNAIITYTVSTSGCGTASQSAPITVNPVLNAGSISGGSSVCAGSSLNLTSNGNSGGTWSSSNTSVATIDAASGIVTSITAGNTTITYSVSNTCGNSNTTQLVTVTAVPSAGTVSGAAAVCAGASTPFTSNGTSGGAWSSSNTAVATVNPATGVVTAVAAGNATITYTVTTGCGSSTASGDLTVNRLASAGTISGPNAVCVIASINLSSGIAGGTWSSNSPTIATVNSSGKVTGVAAGNATITYTVSTTCGTNVASYNVTVNAAPNAGMIPGTVSSVCVGSNILLTDVGGMTGGIWRSVNPARATVDPATGVVTGVSAGNTIIAYTVTNSCGTSSANLPISVNSLPNAGTISGLTSVCVASTINLSASGDAGGIWTSNNTTVATVDPNTGIVSGVASGTATIIYTVGSDAVCGTSSATYLITVNPLAIAGTINGTTTLCTGLSTTLTSNGSVGGTWSSSNSAVASVNSVSGVVTGISAGNATINYTVTNLCGSTTASTTVTVNPVANAGTISGSTSVCTGSTINLSSNVPGGTWSSSSPAIAGIGVNTGIVTGTASGNTTITYTVTTSCGTASTTYAISVNPLPNAGSISGTTFVCTGSTTTLFSNVNGGTWSSSNTSAATVNPATGVVTGVSAGNTTINYTVSSGCGNASASVIVTVGASPNAGTVTGVSALCVGSTAIFTSNGTGGGSWSSNNTSAATVDPVTGVVSGVTMGSATISYTVTSTCGSSVSSANITISALPNAGTISGAAAICTGSTSAFTSNGMTGGSWSSNNNLVATVNSSGVVTGIATGNATITYTVVNTCGTATATANVTINALPNAGTVTGASSVCAGVITAFSSSGTGGGSWSSNNTAAATVDPVTGAVTGVAAGSATISYTVTAGACGSSTSSANITVNPSPNPGTISGATSVCVGTTTTFTTNGMILGTWSSNNTAVATVDPSTGVITGVAAGTTTIKYTIINSCGTASATKAIIVNPLANAGTVTGSSTVCIASATTYTTDGLSGGVWSSNNTSVATVDPASGLVTGVSVGNATITYTVTTGCGTASASSGITVIILPNAGTVSGASSVCAGSNTTYTSNGLSGGTWSSVTPSVATVDPSTGVVTGVSAGNATITYTFTNSCGTSTATKLITVNPLPDAGVVNGASSVCIGSIATFSSSGLGGGSWSSSNPSLASVDPSTGVVTGIAAGNVIITYTSTTPCGMTTATAPVVIIAIPDAGVVNGNTTLCVGAQTTYTSSGMSGGTWSSVTPSVATVDPSTGVVTGVSAGNATIVYTFTNACGSPTASQMITVNPLPNAGTITGATSVCASSQATFTTNGLPGGVWSSDNTGVATVNPTSGVVMGVSSGNATITYTSTTPCGIVSTSAIVTVNAIVNAGTVSGISALCIGSTTPYTTDGTGGGTWSSLTPSVASVNPTTGVVTGVSSGNATITYTVTGCGTSSASKLITVSPASNPGTISGPSSICAGSSVTFTRSGGSGSGTWSSSNTSVATVNSSGTVTGVANGTAVISYAVTSGCATNSSTQSITVTTAPNIVANNITASTDPNSCSASVTLGSNISQLGSGTTLEFRIGFLWFSFPITSTYTFYRGTTPVTVRATNSCGSVMKLFLVTVVDNQPPVITCVPNATRAVNGNSNKYSVRGHEFDATASDGCGVASLVYSLSGATVDGFESDNTSLNNVSLNVGTTTVTWKATDVNGNVSTCSTNITVSANPGHRFMASKAPTLKVKVAPNPTSNYFTLKFSSESAENVKIIVTDELGRTVEQMSNIWPNSNLQIGGKYHPGVYIVQAIQGDYMIPLKLIKEGR
ncbi:MAG: Ig-like domain-containing protein [Ginsengibacter sp.]